MITIRGHCKTAVRQHPRKKISIVQKRVGLALDGSDAGEHLALDSFEEGAATGRHVAHLVGERDVDYALEHLNVDILAFGGTERAGELVGEGEVERIAFRFGVDELLDVFV